MDQDTTVGELKRLAAGFVAERDWEQFHNPKNLSMAIAAESGELMEHFLWCEGKQSVELMEDPTQREEIADEIADIVIYAMHFANRTGLDLSDAIRNKMKANALKYPVEKAKGRSDKYDRL